MKSDYKEGDLIEWDSVVGDTRRVRQGVIIKRLEPGEQVDPRIFRKAHFARTGNNKAITTLYREPSFIILRKMDSTEVRFTSRVPNILHHLPLAWLRPAGEPPPIGEIVKTTFTEPSPDREALPPFVRELGQLRPPPLREAVPTLGLDGLGALKSGQMDCAHLPFPTQPPLVEEAVVHTETFETRDYLEQLEQALKLCSRTAKAFTFSEHGLIVIRAVPREIKEMRKVPGLFLDRSNKYTIVLFQKMGFWEWLRPRATQVWVGEATEKDMKRLPLLLG